MNRKILKASDGMILTNGEVYGSEIYLADGVDESTFYEIPESQIVEGEIEGEILNSDEASIDDYKEALARLGVSE